MKHSWKTSDTRTEHDITTVSTLVESKPSPGNHNAALYTGFKMCHRRVIVTTIGVIPGLVFFSFTMHPSYLLLY